MLISKHLNFGEHLIAHSYHCLKKVNTSSPNHQHHHDDGPTDNFCTGIEGLVNRIAAGLVRESIHARLNANTLTTLLNSEHMRRIAYWVNAQSGLQHHHGRIIMHVGDVMLMRSAR
jgi:hypothetical protein